MDREKVLELLKTISDDCKKAFTEGFGPELNLTKIKEQVDNAIKSLEAAGAQPEVKPKEEDKPQEEKEPPAEKPEAPSPDTDSPKEQPEVKPKEEDKPQEEKKEPPAEKPEMQPDKKEGSPELTEEERKKLHEKMALENIGELGNQIGQLSMDVKVKPRQEEAPKKDEEEGSKRLASAQKDPSVNLKKSSSVPDKPEEEKNE